jgi:hypothetical protein
MPRPPHPTRPVASLADFDPVADALVDKLTLTCHLTFAQPPAGGAAILRARLAAAKIVAARGGKWAKVAFQWTCPNSRARLSLDGGLAIADGANGAVLAVGNSTLDVNLLTLLRKQVSHDPGVGLDKRLNFVGPPEWDRPNLLGLQLATVAGLLDAFLRACAVASRSPVSMSLWVRAAELNRDLVRADAVEIAHRLVGEANPWHRVGWARHYRDAADREHDGNYATVTWPNDRADAPIRMKFYAKTADLLRTEICFDNREAVLLCAGQGVETWPDGPATNGTGIAERLAILARAAVPLLDAMSAHVARLDAPQREVLDLIVALAPLLRAGALPPPGRAGALARWRKARRPDPGRSEGYTLPPAGVRPVRRVGVARQQHRAEGARPDRGRGRAARGIARPRAALQRAIQLRRCARRHAARPVAGSGCRPRRRAEAVGRPRRALR